MDGAAGAGGGVGIVGDHDDGLAVLLVERLEQREDFVAGLAVEVAGGFVAEQDVGIGDDGAGDADALLLAAGERARVMLRAVRRGRRLPARWRRARGAAALLRCVSSSGSSTLRSALSTGSRL